MNFIVFNKRRLPEAAILGFKIVEQDINNSKPYMKIIIYGKFEIVYFNSNKELRECADKLIYDLGLVNISSWHLKARAVKEYMPVINKEEYVFYILVKTTKIEQIKIRFSSEESLKEELCNFDQIFNVK